MVWAGVSARGKTSLVFVEQNVNAQVYVDIRSDNLMPFLEEKCVSRGDAVKFQ